jgi:release factor glutamine methyltransferase
LSEVATETAVVLSRKAAQHLAERGIENATLEADLLLADVLGLTRLQLYLQHDRPIEITELERFRQCVRRRLRREPLQYILGRVSFRKLELQVDRRVLIPRPETEILVGEILAWIDRAGAPIASALDIGTGSGAIALSLAQEAKLRVVATDISTAALEVAAENARRLGLSDRIELRPGTLWNPLEPTEQFDIIASNPPYVAETERADLAPEVCDWEPAVALFSGDNGLQIIRQIAAGAPSHLRAGGLLALEIGATQADAVVAWIKADPRYDTVRVVRDLAGRERIVLTETR